MTFRRTRCPTTAHITQAELREQIYYASDFGLFLWRHAAKGRKVWDVAGHTRVDGYRIINISGKSCYGHRLAWLYVYGEWPDGLIDHIDGDTSNNAIWNLRVVTRRTNAENVRRATRASKTGFLGVFLRADTGKFSSQIKVNGRRITLGSFDTAELASEAYLAAKRRLHTGFML